MNRPDPASDTFPLPDPTGAVPGSPGDFGAGGSEQEPQGDPEEYERSAWRALDASEFERVLARADELEALGRGSQARQLRAEVREGLIGQMLADPTRSSAARWLGLLLRVDPEAAEEFERRARQGATPTQSPPQMPPASAAAEAAPAELAPAEPTRGPARTLPLGAPLQRCGLRLRLDGLGELGLAACEALQWAPAVESGAPPGARFEPGLWLAHEGPRDLCLPLGPGSFEVLDERGEAAGAPRESLELRDALRFRWTTPGGGAPRILSAQRWGAVWLLSITRGADLAGARRIAWWPGPGRLELDPADTRLPLASLPAALGLALDAAQLRLSSTAGLRPTTEDGASGGPELSLDLPLPGPVALAVGGRTWLRVEPWEQAP
ncbi:MAG: hypothetical protein ACYS26_13685 [Planctomycetota bacterium]